MIRRAIVSVILLLSFAAPAAAALSDVDPLLLADSCAAPVLSANMQIGSRDAATAGDVSKLQAFLYSRKYLPTPPTGYFGTATEAAVASYQAAVGISVTGTVGPLTRANILASACVGGSGADAALSGDDLEILNPLGGHLWTVGDTQVFRWDAPNVPSKTKGYIQFTRTDGSSKTVRRIRSVRNDGEHTWKVGKNSVASGTYNIEIVMGEARSTVGPITIAPKAKQSSVNQDRLDALDSLSTRSSRVTADQKISARHTLVRFLENATTEYEISLTGATRASPVSSWKIDFSCSSDIEISLKAGGGCEDTYTLGESPSGNGNTSFKVWVSRPSSDKPYLRYTVRAYSPAGALLGRTSGSFVPEGEIPEAQPVEVEPEILAEAEFIDFVNIADGDLAGKYRINLSGGTAKNPIASWRVTYDHNASVEISVKGDSDVYYPRAESNGDYSLELFVGTVGRGLQPPVTVNATAFDEDGKEMGKDSVTFTLPIG